MICVAPAAVWFPPEIAERVLQLMQLQCSAMRAAYQAKQRGLQGNEITQAVKVRYMQPLNQRYVLDAVNRASMLRKPGVIFGGRKAWRDLQSGKISKEEWTQRRNDQLYSRGDRTRDGNPHVRVVGEKILIRDPSERGKWLEGKIYLPPKFKPDWACYTVRVLYRDGKFTAKISWNEEPLRRPVRPGAIGLDINPDGVAVVATDGHGNLLNHRYEKAQRLPFARAGKRDHDIGHLAASIVDQAAEIGKAIVLEDLKFRSKPGGRKFNRMRHNFVYRKLTEAVERRAEKCGLPVFKVNPAFTSILGLLKYAGPYSLNRHTAAALVIARRGQGYVERRDFAVTPRDESGDRLNLEGRGRSHTLSRKAYSWLQERFLKPKPADLTGPDPAPG